MDIRHTTFNIIRHLLPRALLALLLAALALSASPALAESTPPGAVSSVSLTRTDGTVTASWDAPSGATKYHVTYSDNGGASWHAPVDDHRNVTTTSLTFSADNAKTYIVGVRAGNDGGWSGWVNSPSAGPYTPPTLTPTPPGAVSSVSLTRTDGTVTASWDAPSGATKYHVTYSDNGGASWHAPVDDHRNVTTTSLTFSADNAKTYIVGVRAGNDGGWSGWVNSPSAGPYMPNPPAAPTGLTAKAGDGSVTLSWDDPSDSSITGYEYNVNHNDTSTGNLSGWGPWTFIAGSGASTVSHTFTGLANGKEYRYHLRAVNAGGAGGAAPNAPPWFAAAVPAVPVPAAPSGLSVTPGDGYLDISWDAVSVATGYDIRAKTAGSSSWHSVANNVSGTSHRYTTDQTIDYIAVRARNADATGPWTELSRLPASNWLNTVQSSGASIASAQSQSQLAAPASVTVTRDNGNNARRIGGEELTVTWSAVTGAGGYNLTCSSRSGWRWWQCGSTDSGSTTTLKVTQGEHGKMQWVLSYMVAVRAVTNNPAQASDWTRSVDAHPAHPPVKEQPGQNPISASRSAGSLTLSWIQPKYSTGYEIECATRENGVTGAYTLCADVETATLGSDRRVTATITSWTVGGTDYTVDDSKTYDLIVRTTNAWGKSAFHYAPLIYPKPTLTASNVSDDSATLTIAHHTDAWYYKHTGAGATCDGPVSGTSKDLTGLTAATTYTYSAYSDSGCTSGKLLAAATPFTTGQSISNLSNSKGSGLSFIGRNAERAFAFRTGSNTSGYVLKTVTLALRQYDTSGLGGADIAATLHQMKGTGQYGATSEPADTVLATLSGTAPTSTTWTDTTFTCSGSGCNLSPDTTYFVKTAVQNSQTFRYDWAWTLDSGETKEPGNNGWDILFGHYNDAGLRWQSYSDWHLAGVVFAPNPSLTASNVAATTATLTIAHHTGNWWYKHTTPTGGVCSTNAVTGSSATVTLSGNTSYTFAAYSDSSCSTLLATAASFTTPAATVSVSNLSGANPGGFWVGPAFAQEFRTGSETGGYTLKSVTLDFSVVTNASAFSASIRSKQSNGHPGTTDLATLSGTPASGQIVFTCSTNCNLAGSTDYFVYVTASNTNAALLNATSSDSETLTPSANGWSIANTARYQADSWGEHPQSWALTMKVTATGN